MKSLHKNSLLIFMSLMGTIFSLSTVSAVEVVVTASRIEEDGDTVPASVSIIDEEELGDSPTVLDALSKVPEVIIVTTIPGSSYITMSGFGDNGFSRVLVLIDGVPVNRPDMSSFNWASVPLAGVSRIEVIRGANSVQYGDQAVAGVVNIITSGHDDKTMIAVNTGIGSYLSNHESIAARINLKNFSLFSSYSRIDNYTSRDRTDNSMQNITVAPSFFVGPLTFTSDFYYTPSEYQMPGGLTKEQYDDDPDQAMRQDDFAKSQDYGFRTNSELEIGDLLVKIPFSMTWEDKQVDWYSYTDTLLSEISFLPSASYDFWFDSSQLTLLGGTDIRSSTIDVDRFSSSDRETKTMDATISRSTLSPWGMVKYSLADQLILSAGGRYSFSELEAESDTGIDGDSDSMPFAFNGSATWLPLNNLKVYVNYGRVYRLPALDEQVFYSGYVTDGVYEVDPEYGHSLTAGLVLSNEKLTLTVESFYLRMFDEITYDSVVKQNVNSDETERLGISATGTFTLEQLNITAGYNYVNATYASGDNAGNQIPLVSPHKINGTVKYTFPGNIYLGSNAEYYSSYYEGGDESNSQDQISYRVNWGATVGWEAPAGFELRASINNILDDRTPSMATTYAWYPSTGRVFELGLLWKM